MRRIATVVLMSAATVACSTQVDSSGSDGELSELEADVSGRYIVTLRRDVVSASATSTWAANHDLAPERVFGAALPGFVVRTSPEMAAELRDDPDVLSVEPDIIVSLAEPDLAGGDEVTVDAAQVVPPGITRIGGSTFLTTGFAWVIDTGIDFEHDDLLVIEPLSRNFVRSEPNAGEDLNGHGTHVAGIIAAKDNDIDVVGVVAGNPVVSVRVLNSRGSGAISDIIAGVDYVASRGRPGDVVNMSLSTQTRVAAFDQAVVNAANRGLLFTLSAGNESEDASNTSPAAVSHPNIFTVSAIGSDDCLAAFSNFGAPVDLAAPGVAVQSTALGGGTISFNGTSQAAPHVAGILLANDGEVATDGVACRDPDGRADPIAHR
jgi:subtilisin family serine protease